MNSDLCCDILEVIDDSDELYRRFTSDQLKPNGRVSSAAFHNTHGTEGMSVDLGRLSSIERSSHFRGEIRGVASFHAGYARRYDQIIFHDPDYEYDNDAHTTVKGNKNKRISRLLSNGAIVRFNPF
jgi:hypothetical protein